MQTRSTLGQWARRFAVTLVAATTIAAMTGCAATQPVVASRDDASITKDVQARLPAGSSIKVDTKEGVVSLIGGVETETERTSAEQIARDTPGVRKVDNNVRYGFPIK